MGSTVSIGKLLINAVMSNKLKKLRSLSQNGTVVGKGVDWSPFMGRKHYRRTESTYPIRVSETEHGKPVRLPLGKANRKASR